MIVELNTEGVATLLGVTTRQVDHWIRKGYVPSITSRGSGNHRRYELSDIVYLAKLAGLVSIGFLPEPAVELLRTPMAVHP